MHFALDCGAHRSDESSLDGILTQLPHLRAASDYFEAVRGGFGSTGEGPALCFQRGVFGSLARCVEKPV
jgi:hypothetical protein